MGRFVRSVSVSASPRAAYRHLLVNIGPLLRELPEVSNWTGRPNGTNKTIRVTVRSEAGDDRRFDIPLQLGWGWKTPIEFSTATAHGHDLPPSFHQAHGTIAVREDGDGCIVEVVAEVDGVADDDAGLSDLFDRGAAVLRANLPRKRMRWY